jgi:hypothetical protein
MSAGVNPQHVAYALKAQAIEDDPSSGDITTNDTPVFIVIIHRLA